MLRGLLVAAAVGAVALVVIAATGGVDDLRAQLPGIRNPFKEANDAIQGNIVLGGQWGAVAKEANSICTSHPQSGFVVSATIPADRQQYVRAIGREIDRETAIQAELAALQPPANYEGPYSLFLNNRQEALAALERMPKAAKEKDREDFALAAGEVKQRKRFIDHYAAVAGMPDCVF
jgi:hypothetical protein